MLTSVHSFKTEKNTLLWHDKLKQVLETDKWQALFLQEEEEDQDHEPFQLLKIDRK